MSCFREYMVGGSRAPPPDGYGGGPPQVVVDAPPPCGVGVGVGQAPPPVGWVWLVHFAFEVIFFTQNDLVIAECWENHGICKSDCMWAICVIESPNCFEAAMAAP